MCEAAVNRLKSERRRTIRGTLYVSGDSVRLVDDDTKGLILDQTIEKVSFCAPDRNFEKGFSYICRDGTTRRWMCHGFMAVGDTGERLSHAVGCAFGICLENKQKRDKTNVSVQYNSTDNSFTRNGSFRVGTMTERLADPQALKVTPESPRTSDAEVTKAVERPRPPETMYQRQASFRGLGQLSGQTPFKRNSKGQLSLRLNDLPSNRERRLLSESPILEDIELPSSNLEDNSNRPVDLLTSEDPFTAAELAAVSGASGTSTPAFRGGDSSSTYSMSPPPSLLIPVKLHKLPKTPESELNPWDGVPDQPYSPPPRVPSSLPPSVPSSLPSSSLPPKIDLLHSLNTLSTFSQPRSVDPTPSQPPFSSDDFNFSNPGFLSAPHWSLNPTDGPELELDCKMSPFLSKGPEKGTSSGYHSPTSTNSGTSLPRSTDTWTNNLQGSLLESSIQHSILEDPFDAEWAAIATRNYGDSDTKPANRNPFLQDSSMTSFELHL